MKRYLVTGIHPVCGRRPGEEFTAALLPEHERALVAGGAVRVIRTPRPRPVTKP